jgi:hypothetical protein
MRKRQVPLTDAMDDKPGLLTGALLGAGARRPLAGVTWLPEALLAELAPALPGPARRLARLVADADLDFAFVPADADWAPYAASLLVEEGVGVVWAVSGPLWPVIRRRGITRGIATTVRDPDSLTDGLRAELERVEADVERGLACGAAAVVVAEDLAGAEGPLVAPDFAIAHAVPALAGVAAMISDAGRAPVFHSDGDIRHMLDAVLDAGFTAVHSGSVDEDRAVFLREEVARRGLTVIGGLPGVVLEKGGAPAARVASELIAMERSGTLVIADDGGLVTPAGFAALGRLGRYVRARAQMGADGSACLPDLAGPPA